MPTRHALPALCLTLLDLLASTTRADVPDLVGVTLGNAAAPSSEVVKQDGDTFIVTGRGRTNFNHDDRGAGFASFKTDLPNFTLTARIAKAPTGTDDAKYGLAIRAGTGPVDRMIAARHVGSGDAAAIDWLLRFTPAKGTHDGSERLFRAGRHADLKAADGFWLRLTRSYPTVTVHYSTDGKDWQPIGPDYHLAMLEQTVHVGLMVTAGGDGKTPISVTFDNVSFTTPQAMRPQLARESFVEYDKSPQIWQMYLVQADTKGGKDSQAWFLLKPKDMPWKDMRAAIYTTGDKEILLDDDTMMKFENGPGKRRRPVGMSEWEGIHEIKNLNRTYQTLAHYGIVRIATPGRFDSFEEGMAELAETFDAPQIANLPLFPTGASAAGGQSAQFSNAYPDRILGNYVTLIGAAGADMNNKPALNFPRLYVYGSRDTGGQHHKQLTQLAQAFRENHARWGAAPMWGGHHRWWYADRLMLPYIISLLDKRIPADADYAAGPVKLKDIPEEAGYLGLHDTWDTSLPQVVAWDKATQAQRRGNTSWLPDELVARTWQAFCSDRPRTVIHFPRTEGNGGIRESQHPGRENHFLPANEPWNLLASGPMGDNITVEYFAGPKPLKVLKRYHDNPYLVQLEPLEPGLHIIHAITTIGDKKEISHPSAVLFQERTPN